MTPVEIRNHLTQESVKPADQFRILRAIAAMYNGREADGRESLIRVLDRRELFEPLEAMINSLLARYGLYPYMAGVDDTATTADALLYELHRPLDYDNDVVLHRVQADIYRRILDGESIILSAPTSFGKSLVLDAVAASGRFENIAVVVPTLALIDETRKRLSRLRDTYKVITHPSQTLDERNILVMTQERLLDVAELPRLDLFMIDEFYKLDSRNEENRPVLLNHALHRLMTHSRAFYMAGPNVRDLAAALPAQFTATFTSTDFKTVVSNLRVMPKPARGDEIAALVEVCRELEGPTLIFCSSPEKTRKVAEALLTAGLGDQSPEMAPVATWVAEEYHPDWLVARALTNGVGIHHARLPRWLGQYTVGAFNSGILQFFVCTSTMIEGVNTSAKNVVVFDHKIKNRNIDYFTYSNIAGRSGRMRQHFVGEVIVFREPPAEELPIVDVPVYNQASDTPLSLLIQLSDEELTEESKRRLEGMLANATLPLAVLRESRGIDPERQLALAREIARMAPSEAVLLAWNGYPTWEELLACCQLIVTHLRPIRGRENGVSSARQLTFRLRLAQTTQGDVRQLVNNELSGTSSTTRDDPDAAVEEVLGFLRQWVGFDMPRLLSCLQRVVNHVLPQRGIARRANYSPYVAACESMFLPAHVALLDEFGMPPSLVDKLRPHLPPAGSGIDAVLAEIRRLDVKSLQLDQTEQSLFDELRRTI
ncbi:MULTISPECIES: DEAD/DEAH box helicase [unclassified Nocardioides]|uniref:DEAD/DEAH box helicase n=1 Tax=unclassified Nocardioides TaxID=2615069 RepID=UPI0009EB6A39|nr:MULTISPECIES: DEAD/DEAH box helicase [unclassified Nocardioides]